MLGHRVKLCKFKKTEIVSSIFSDHNAENQLEGKKCKKHKHLEAKPYTTKQPMDHWRNQRGNKIPRDTWKWKHNDPNIYGMQQKQFQEESL